MAKRVTAPRSVVGKLHGMASIVAAGRSTAPDRYGPACRRQPNTQVPESQVCMSSRGSYQGGDRVESFPPLLRHRLVVIS